MATNYPDGVQSYNMPVIPQAANAIYTGNVFFVNSATGTDVQAQGKSLDLPFASINYAITQCTANNGDLIVVAPNHAESVTAAGGLTAGVAGVTVMGVGAKTNRPTITLSTATTATVLITAANVKFQNIRFDATGIDAIVTVFDVQAEGFTLDGCEVYFAKTGAVCLSGLTVDSAAHANHLTLNNNYIHGDDAANCTNFVQLVGGDNISITNNVIAGSFTTTLGCINNITAAVTNITISNNVLVNATASATKVVVLLTGSTGWITGNRTCIGSLAVPFTADACWWAGNWNAAAVATDSTLV